MTKVLDHIVSPKASKKWLKGIGVAVISSMGAGGLVVGVIKSRERKDANRVLRDNIIARHNILQKEWNDFLSDPERVLDNPALNMHNHQVHIHAFEALRSTNFQRPYFTNYEVKNVKLSPFYNSVVKAETKWMESKKRAAEIGLSDLSEEQVRHLKKAKTQLRHLKNPQKTPAEKKRAYDAFCKEFKSVMLLNKTTEKALKGYLK